MVVNKETPDHDEWFGEYQSSRSNLGAGQSLMRVDSKMAKRKLKRVSLLLFCFVVWVLFPSLISRDKVGD